MGCATPAARATASRLGDDETMPPWDETPLEARIDQLERDIRAATALVLVLPRTARDRAMVERTITELETQLNSAREQLRRAREERLA